MTAKSTKRKFGTKSAYSTAHNRLSFGYTSSLQNNYERVSMPFEEPRKPKMPLVTRYGKLKSCVVIHGFRLFGLCKKHTFGNLRFCCQTTELLSSPPLVLWPPSSGWWITASIPGPRQPAISSKSFRHQVWTDLPHEIR